MDEHSIDSEELVTFLTEVWNRYGYDFRDYAQGSIRRRIRYRLKRSSFRDFAELRKAVLEERREFDALLLDFSISTTEMFRDPAFFTAFREEIVPWLRTFPSFKVWQAGCSTGQESYSLAILLDEEKLLEKALIYATDYNPRALRKAQSGLYAVDTIQDYNGSFHRAGLKGPFSQYFTAKYGNVVMKQRLKDRIVFAEHNLVTDSVFSEVQVVVCRNVLIYFNRALQDRVLSVFASSLVAKGYLCLGTKESLVLSRHANDFETVRAGEKIYRNAR